MTNQVTPIIAATDIQAAGAAVSVADESAVITSMDISSDSMAAVGLRELGHREVRANRFGPTVLRPVAAATKPQWEYLGGA